MRPDGGMTRWIAARGDLAAVLLLGAGLVGLALSRFAAGDERAGAAAPHDAVPALQRHLAAQPADAGAWLRFARAEAAAGEGGARAAGALALSILTAPRAPKLLLPRLDLGFALWPTLDGEQRMMVLDQVRHGWAADPAGLAAVARRHEAAPLVRLALAGREADLARFADLY